MSLFNGLAAEHACLHTSHMSQIAIAEAQDRLLEVARETAISGEVMYLVTEDGQQLAAIVPADYAAQIEAEENAADIADADAAMAKIEAGAPTVPWEQIKARLDV